MSMKIIRSLTTAMLSLVLSGAFTNPSFAHGEKALEPFIRMRTIQWYDVEWTQNRLDINDSVVVTGKFHVAEDWPRSVPKPDAAYLNVSAPGPVFVRTERSLNGLSSLSSTSLQLGADYEFKIVLKARYPGRFHLHPFFNLKDAGAVMGPGHWIEVTGDAGAFTNPVAILDGSVIEMESYGLANGVFWHLLWLAVGSAWLLWWVRRPLFIPRYKMLHSGHSESLITPIDNRIAKFILVAVPVVVLGAYSLVESRHPNNIPLQAASDQISALPQIVNESVRVETLRTEYRIPERSMNLDVRIHNGSDDELSIGEFQSANVRFLRSGVSIREPGPVAEAPIAREGLRVGDSEPIRPGETRTLQLKAVDALWEIEKLEGLFRDADSRLGGLLFLYAPSGKRYIASISGAVIPKFD